MTRNEKRELFEEVAWMDAAGIFIMGGMIGLLGGHLGSLEIMEWGIGVMLGVGVFVGILSFVKRERNKGLEIMDSYRFSSGK